MSLSYIYLLNLSFNMCAYNIFYRITQWMKKVTISSIAIAAAAAAATLVVFLKIVRNC